MFFNLPLYLMIKLSQERVRLEEERRQKLGGYSKSHRMDKEFDCTSEKECVSCFYDLYLSASGCSCCPNRFSCLNHAESLCSCPLENRYFLFRYDFNELALVVEALEGNISAISQWGQIDSRLPLSADLNPEMKHPFLSQRPHLEALDTCSVFNLGNYGGGFMNMLMDKVRSHPSNGRFFQPLVNCIEVINIGTVVPADRWSDSQAIFPRGTGHLLLI